MSDACNKSIKSMHGSKVNWSHPDQLNLTYLNYRANNVIANVLLKQSAVENNLPPPSQNSSKLIMIIDVLHYTALHVFLYRK